MSFTHLNGSKASPHIVTTVNNNFREGCKKVWLWNSRRNLSEAFGLLLTFCNTRKVCHQTACGHFACCWGNKQNTRYSGIRHTWATVSSSAEIIHIKKYFRQVEHSTQSLFFVPSSVRLSMGYMDKKTIYFRADVEIFFFIYRYMETISENAAICYFKINGWSKRSLRSDSQTSVNNETQLELAEKHSFTRQRRQARFEKCIQLIEQNNSNAFNSTQNHVHGRHGRKTALKITTIYNGQTIKTEDFCIHSPRGISIPCPLQSHTVDCWCKDGQFPLSADLFVKI